jgi:hypothetical protein
MPGAMRTWRDFVRRRPSSVCAPRDKPQLAGLVLFLSQAYNLKAVADYELGPGASVPLDRASEAIDRAAQSVEQIASMMA